MKKINNKQNIQVFMREKHYEIAIITFYLNQQKKTKTDAGPNLDAGADDIQTFNSMWPKRKYN